MTDLKWNFDMAKMPKTEGCCVMLVCDTVVGILWADYDSDYDHDVNPDEDGDGMVYTDPYTGDVQIGDLWLYAWAEYSLPERPPFPKELQARADAELAGLNVKFEK